ncbi:MAG: nucleotidyltransferase domain-containing protein [Thermoprotei archaeon]
MDWRAYGVEYALLFGSRVTGRVFKGDWDIAVKFRRFDLDNYSSLLVDLAKELKVREDMIDLVPIDENTPCALILEIERNKKLLYAESFDSFLDDWLKRVSVCIDFEISKRKLRVLEAMEEAVRKGWEQ